MGEQTVGSAQGLMLGWGCPGAGRGLQGTCKGGFLPWDPVWLRVVGEQGTYLFPALGAVPLAGPGVSSSVRKRAEMLGWRSL